MPCLAFVSARKLRPYHGSLVLRPRGARAAVARSCFRGINYSSACPTHHTPAPLALLGTTIRGFATFGHGNKSNHLRTLSRNHTSINYPGLKHRRYFSTVTPGTTDHLLLTNSSPATPLAKEQQQQQQKEVGNIHLINTSNSSTSEHKQQHTMELSSSSSHYAHLLGTAAEQAEHILASFHQATTTTDEAESDSSTNQASSTVQQALNAADALLRTVSEMQNNNHQVEMSSSSSVINMTHWRSLHRTIVGVTSTCLDWIEINHQHHEQQQQQEQESSQLESLQPTAEEEAGAAAAATEHLLACTLAIARRARYDLDMPLHLPLYQRLADALTRQHVLFSHQDATIRMTNRCSDSSLVSLQDMGTISDVLLEVASHANVWEISALLSPASSSSSSYSLSFFNTPLLILVEHGHWKEASELLTALSRRRIQQRGSSDRTSSLRTFILDEQVAMELILVLRQTLRQQRQAAASREETSAEDTNENKMKRIRPPSERNAMTLVSLLEPTLLHMIQQHDDDDEDELEEEQLSLPELLYQQDYFYSYPKPMRQFLQDRWFQSLHRDQAAAILSHMLMEQRQQQHQHHHHQEADNYNHEEDEDGDDFSSSSNADNETNDDQEELADALFFLLGQDGDDDELAKHADPLDLEIETILTKRIQNEKVKCLVSNLLRHAEFPARQGKTIGSRQLASDSEDETSEEDDDHPKSDNDILLPTRRSRRRTNRRTSTTQQQRLNREDDFDMDDQDNDDEEDSSDSDSDDSDDDDDDDDDDDLFRQRHLSGQDLPDIIAQVRSWNGGRGVVLTEEYKDTLYYNMLRNAQREMKAKFSPSPSTTPR